MRSRKEKSPGLEAEINALAFQFTRDRFKINMVIVGSDECNFIAIPAEIGTDRSQGFGQVV